MSANNPTEDIILVVDDNPTNLEMLCDFLADAGFEVLVATDGESAIEQAVYAQPNLILLDVLMPGIDGFETCYQLKANPSTKAIPVIFMTALGETPNKLKGFEVGAVDYVTKPIQLEEVLARINNQLTIQNLQQELQQQNLQLEEEVKKRLQAEDLACQQAHYEQLLNEIAQRIRKSLDLDEILNTTVNEVRQFLQTDRVLIYRFLEDWSGVVEVEAVSTPSLSILNNKITDPCFGESYVCLYQEGRILVIDDIHTAELAPCHVELLQKFQVRANLVLPILQGEQLWGLLIAHHCSEPRHWLPLEVDLLKRLSTQIAIAIQQGQLYQQLGYLQEQSERLLLNILPDSIAQRLKQDPDIIADSYDNVSVLFADLVGFTEFSAQTSAKELVNILNLIFSTFDQLAEQYGLEKIKTIGDAYMVAAGLPIPHPDHAIATAEMALDMQAEMAKFAQKMGQEFQLRIGINSGSVVAGVIGIKKFIYDLWGDTVNMASRMESQGINGAIQVTAATYELLRDKYLFEERGIISVKGKGEMTTYLLKGRI